MKKLFCAPLLVLCLVASPACTSLSAASDAVAVATSSTPLGDRTVMDERAMYAAEALYNVPAQAYVTADTRGLLTPAMRRAVRPVLVEARQVLLTVREAYRVGDATTFGQRVAALRALKERALALLPATN